MTTPDGSLLSCYTASIAESLHRRGMDWLAVIGLSSVVAVRPQGRLFAFAHHMPSLRALAAPGVRRAGTSEPTAVVAGLRAALAAAGHVIAVADAGRLPWTPALRGRRVPHWLVIDGQAERRWHVTDRFSALVGPAEHHPWQGWVGQEDLIGMLRLSSLAPEQILRERLAFGDEEPAHLPVCFQWYAAGVLPEDHHYQVAPPPDRISPAGGWLLGPDAVAALASSFTRPTPDQRADAYCQADDLWVASRHRKLRAIALSQVLTSGDPRLAAAEALSRAWQRVPMVVQYAAQAETRGRDKSSTVASVLEDVAEAEAADALMQAKGST
jgi:hypothetical protein